MSLRFLTGPSGRAAGALAAWTWTLLTVSAALGQDDPGLVAPTEPLSAEEQLARFHLPPGFEIQLVAAEPNVQKPMNLKFDAAGRLYATQSVEYPFPLQPGERGRDVVRRYSQFDAQGRPSKIETIVEGLNIPIGVTPVDRGGLLYHSIPNIYRVDDPEDDGEYGEPRVAYGEFSWRDTHGMTNSFTRWIDGWVYATHGYANTSTVQGADGQSITMNSGNAYRMRADGSHVEQWTHGQVNPFGMSFDSLGNIYTSDCHTKPLYMLLRGAWYPSFGKPHDGLGFGPEMCEHLHGSTGIAGVVYYAADHFPQDFRENVFIGNPVTGRVNRDKLDRHGSSYVAVAQEDFITCDDPWFRPVDLQLGPDGALYIADFYNKIIGHYEVPLLHPGRDRERGRIWRVDYTGDGERRQAASMPNLANADDAELAARLGDPNLAVRVLATETLAERALPTEVEAMLADAEPTEQAGWRRAHAMWLVERARRLSESEILRLAADADRLVRVHLMKLLAERPDWSRSSLDVASLVRGRLDDDDPFVRRAAADALARHPAPENVAPLLSLWSNTPADDTHLVHTARMALRDQLAAPGGYSLALDIAANDDAASGKFAEISLGVRNGESARYLAGYMSRRAPSDAQLSDFIHDVVRYADEPELPSAFGQVRAWAGSSLDRQGDAAFAVCGACEERGIPRPQTITDWADQVVNDLLDSDRKSRIERGLQLARDLKLAKHYDLLATLASAASPEPSLRRTAMEACLAVDREPAIAIVGAAASSSAEPVAVRRDAIALLATAGGKSSTQQLVAALATAPAELALEIARGLATSRDGGEALLAEIAAGRASPRLLRSTSVFGRLVAAKVPDVEQRIRELTAGTPDVDEHIVALVNTRREGYLAASPDATRGREVYRKVCANCHLLGGEGGRVGPGLDGVGLRGLDRLLEDTLDPSRNVDQAFRSTILATDDGRVVTGLALREEGEVLVLADAEGKEVRIPQATIEDRSTSGVSPMPANLGESVSEADYYHLLRFLLDQQQPVAQASGGQ